MVLLIAVSIFPGPAHAKARHRRGRRAPASVVKLNKVASCKKTDSPKTVWIVKQWHLAPTLITKNFKEKYPQERNQTAIYQALAAAIKKKEIQAVIAEGCGAGNIDADFKVAYNGWSYGDLHKIAQTKGYDKIITSVPLKLEARFGDDLLTVCGDDEKLIQEGNLRLSNLRGWMGFWTRMHETYVDDKLKMYSDAAADLLKVPKTTSTKDILVRIRDRLHEEFDGFKKSLGARNAQFAGVAKATEFTTAAVIIGGLHASDLKSKLETEGLNCEVFEPPGYQREDEQLVDTFEKALGQTEAPK